RRRTSRTRRMKTKRNRIAGRQNRARAERRSWRRSRGGSIGPLICEPAEQSLGWPAVHDPIGRNTRQPRMSQRDVGVSELKCRMRVAVEGEQAAGGERIGRQRVIEILTG